MKRHVPALDGLRGIAVLAVLFFHTLPALMPGGFLGVDIFFVLSGYLITIGLVRRIDAGKGAGFRTFWLKRARRLLPALGAMLVATTALSWIASREFPAALGKQWLGAMSFSTNWLLIGADTDYFDTAAPPLFQHLWSLAIEEQFYLAWPLVVAALVFLFTRHSTDDDADVLARRRGYRTGTVGLLAVSGGAAMFGLTLSGASISRVYFGTDTHLFGILLGATVALAMTRFDALPAGRPAEPSRAFCAVAWLLFAGLIAGMFLVSGQDRSTYYWVLFAFAWGTAVIIRYLVAQQEYRSSRLARLLSGDLLSWFGARSYALYLWHWPLLVLARIAAPHHDSPALYWLASALAIIATLTLSAGSYTWLEQPIIQHGYRAYFRRVKRWFTRFLTMPKTSTQRFRTRPAIAIGLIMIGLATSVSAGLAIAHSPAESQLRSQISAAQEAIRQQAQDQATAQPSPTAQSEPGAAKQQGAEVPPTVGASPENKREPVPKFSAQQLTGEKQPADFGAQITAVGDSVMLAAAPAMLAEMPQVDIHAEVGEQFHTSLDRVQYLSQQGLLRDVVVISVGTNGPATEEQLDQLLAIAGKDRQIILVGPHGERHWIPGMHPLLKKFAKDHDNVTLADWDTAAAHAQDFASDGIHPGTQGGKIYSRMVRLIAERTLD